jgi:hypothetical protein
MVSHRWRVASRLRRQAMCVGGNRTHVRFPPFALGRPASERLAPRLMRRCPSATGRADDLPPLWPGHQDGRRRMRELRRRQAPTTQPGLDADHLGSRHGLGPRGGGNRDCVGLRRAGAARRLRGRHRGRRGHRMGHRSRARLTAAVRKAPLADDPIRCVSSAAACVSALVACRSPPTDASSCLGAVFDATHAVLRWRLPCCRRPCCCCCPRPCTNSCCPAGAPPRCDCCPGLGSTTRTHNSRSDGGGGWSSPDQPR